MSQDEQEAIEEIRSMLAEHVADFRVFKTKLLGDDRGETPMGRVPQLEAEVKRLKNSNARNTRLRWVASGIFLCANAIGWVVTLWSHISGAFKR